MPIAVVCYCTKGKFSLSITRSVPLQSMKICSSSDFNADEHLEQNQQFADKYWKIEVLVRGR